MFCQNCGNEIETNIKYCPECGSEINSNNQSVPPVSHMPQQYNQSNNTENTIYQEPEGKNRGFASLAMVFGILTIVIFCLAPIFAIPALIFGIISIKKKEPETGKAYFGAITGGIILAISIIGLINKYR